MDIEPVEMGKVIYSTKAGVATVILNRPERLNALDHAPGGLYRSMMAALERADQDDEVRCIVVTSTGRAFSSGGDISGGNKGDAVDWYWFLQESDADNERIRDMRKPVIGAINGFCYGAGLMLAVHFDILVAVETAEFGLIESRFGEVGVDVLTFLVGPQWAKLLVLSGELISARKAQEIGLVTAVFPTATFESKVYDLARRIASVPPTAAMLNRRVVNSAMDLMGWKQQKHAANALNAVIDSVGKEQRAANGRKFSELREQGWSEFKAARDEPFTPRWLED
jgi:enoyl-CoA hydratase